MDRQRMDRKIQDAAWAAFTAWVSQPVNRWDISLYVSAETNINRTVVHYVLRRKDTFLWDGVDLPSLAEAQKEAEAAMSAPLGIPGVEAWNIHARLFEPTTLVEPISAAAMTGWSENVEIQTGSNRC